MEMNDSVVCLLWKFFKDRNWPKHPLPVWPQDYIIRAMLVETPDFDHTNALTQDIL